MILDSEYFIFEYKLIINLNSIYSFILVGIILRMYNDMYIIHYQVPLRRISFYLIIVKLGKRITFISSSLTLNRDIKRNSKKLFIQ